LELVAYSDAGTRMFTRKQFPGFIKVTAVEREG